MKIDAILPAGGRISGEFAQEAGTEVKALIDIGGATALERILAALDGTGMIERKVVIGPSEIAEHPVSDSADAVLPETGGTGPENILRGLDWLRERDGEVADRVLVVNTDLPFVTPESLVGFAQACPPEADICLPLIARSEFDARFPGLRDDFVRLRDGEWTIGCVFLVDPAALDRNRKLIDNAFLARKSQIGMALLLGPVFIARFLTRRLTVAHIEQRCESLLGCASKGIRGCGPELGFDIDGPEDYHYAVEHCNHL